MEDVLQVDVCFQYSRCDEDVGMTSYVLGFLAYECKESRFSHRGGRLSSVDRPKERRCCGVAMFGFGSGIDRFGIDQGFCQGFKLLEDVENTLLRRDWAILRPEYAAGELLHTHMDGIEIRW